MRRDQILGKGGHAVVRKSMYEGRLIARKQARSRQTRKRLIQEFDVLSSMAPDANLVQLIAQDDSDLCLEYIDGMTLQALTRSRWLPFGAAVYVAEMVLKALHHVHEHGWVHCDVSPNNVMITRRGDVKLIDLGAARRIGDTGHQGNRVAASLAYASPEVLKHREVDARSDIYSVGAVLYELIVGERFVDHASLANVLNDREVVAPLRTVCPTAPVELDQAVARFLALDPASRPQDAQEAQRALPHAPLGQGELATMMAILRTERPRRRWAVPAVMLTICVGGVMAVASINIATPDNPQLVATNEPARLENVSCIGLPTDAEISLLAEKVNTKAEPIEEPKAKTRRRRQSVRRGGGTSAGQRQKTPVEVTMATDSIEHPKGDDARSPELRDAEQPQNRGRGTVVFHHIPAPIPRMQLDGPRRRKR